MHVGHQGEHVGKQHFPVGVGSRESCLEALPHEHPHQMFLSAAFKLSYMQFPLIPSVLILVNEFYPPKGTVVDTYMTFIGLSLSSKELSSGEYAIYNNNNNMIQR